jgi:hypothetical protein
MYESRLYLRVQKYYKLSENHTTLMNTILDTHTNYLENNILFDETGAPNPKLKKARMKFKQFIKTCSELLKYSTELRLSRIQYDKKIPMKSLELFLQEILRVFLIGPLGSFIQTEIGSGRSTFSEESDAFILQFVKTQCMNYKKEYLSYDPVAVRQKLEASKEREKQRFIGELDAKGEEERRVELLKKQLGIGRWAIGGTKLVYSYDPDQWDKNRMEMELDYATAAGLVADTGRNVGPVPGQMLDDGLEHANYEEADRGYGDEGMDFGAYGDDE